MKPCQSCKNYYLRNDDSFCFNCGSNTLPETKNVWEWSPSFYSARNFIIIAGICFTVPIIISLILITPGDTAHLPGGGLNQGFALANMIKVLMNLLRILTSVSGGLACLLALICVLKFERKTVTIPRTDKDSLVSLRKDLLEKQKQNSAWLGDQEVAERKALKPESMNALQSAKEAVNRQNRNISNRLAEINLAQLQNKLEYQVFRITDATDSKEIGDVEADLANIEEDIAKLGELPTQELTYKAANIGKHAGELVAEIANLQALALVRKVTAGKDIETHPLIERQMKINDTNLHLNKELISKISSQAFDGEIFRLETLKLLENGEIAMPAVSERSI